MNTFWTQDLFLKAFNLAASAHNGQKIPGSELPYIIHIASVCSELMAVMDIHVNGDLIMQCGALHDTIEDTDITYETILTEFGKDVADGVKALSKNYSLEKSIQIEDSIIRILQQPKEIWMVKMADRIANLSPPPVFWSSEKRKIYFEQSFLLHSKLKEANLTLADRLKTKIEQYKWYL